MCGEGRRLVSNGVIRFTPQLALRGELHLHVAVPLGSSCVLLKPGDSKADIKPLQLFGVIVIEVDPCKSLYSIIREWPALDDTAETVLIRREGDEIVYLNELAPSQGLGTGLPTPHRPQRVLACRDGGDGARRHC